ncbi:hypothetical protein V1477_015181, partial [Vespula maculifrons]
MVEVKVGENQDENDDDCGYPFETKESFQFDERVHGTVIIVTFFRKKKEQEIRMYESTIGGVAVRSNPEVPLLFLGYNRCGHCGEERGISMIREARPACGRGHTFLLLSIASRINLSQCLVNARTLGSLIKRNETFNEKELGEFTWRKTYSYCITREIPRNLIKEALLVCLDTSYT